MQLIILEIQRTREVSEDVRKNLSAINKKLDQISGANVDKPEKIRLLRDKVKRDLTDIKVD